MPNSNFTIRVEIQGTGATNYDALDRAMHSAGFSSEIKGTDNSGNTGVWILPKGEYDFAGENLNSMAVRDIVQDVLTANGIRAWIVVTEVKSRSWSTRKIRTG